MNRKLRARAEALLMMQECGVRTDSQTLDCAIRIAHHDKAFQQIDTMNAHFEVLARMMREKFPKCPCRACSNNKPYFSSYPNKSKKNP